MSATARFVFALDDLVLASPAPQADCPPLAIGDFCRLNSDGPSMMVVDAGIDAVTCAWQSGSTVEECDFPRACVRRSSP